MMFTATVTCLPADCYLSTLNDGTDCQSSTKDSTSQSLVNALQPHTLYALKPFSFEIHSLL